MEIFGNKKAQKILKQAAESRDFSHAYLLQGPSRLGKREMAKEFARLLLEESFFPVMHPDLIILDGKGESEEIAGIEKVRKMRDKIILSCQKSKVKVVLGLDIDLMKKESLNALLKSLEEPLLNVVFVLTASSETLKTIESRTVVLKCFPLPDCEIAAIAAQNGCAADDIEEIANASVGKPGVLFALLRLKADCLSLAEAIDLDITGRFEFAEKFCKESELDKIQILLYNWIGEARKMIKFASSRREKFDCSCGILKKIVEAFEAAKLPEANVRMILEKLFINL